MPEQPEQTVTPPETTSQDETPETWEGFLDKQDEKVKALYNSHSEALMNTVRATRSERDEFAKQVKALAKQQAEGSEARKALDEMSAKLEKTERRADFLEQATKPEIQCKNISAAWIIADKENLFDKKGLPDWVAIKREAPELFGAVIANANAAQNTQTQINPHANMNTFIRQKAGKQ